MIRAIFRENLQEQGYAVSAARNGPMSLAILKAMYTRGGYYPAAMVLDMQMPRWTGIDTLAEIRRAGLPTPPTVLCSANLSTQTSVTGPAKALGAVAAVPKPRGLEYLNAAVAAAILAKPLQNP